MRTEKNSVASISSNSSPELAENGTNASIAVWKVHFLSSWHADAAASTQLAKNKFRDLRLSFGITNYEARALFVLDKTGSSVAQRLQLIELLGRSNEDLYRCNSEKTLNLFTAFRRV